MTTFFRIVDSTERAKSRFVYCRLGLGRVATGGDVTDGAGGKNSDGLDEAGPLEARLPAYCT